MKYGANTQIWVASFRQENVELIDKVREMGFDLIELSVVASDDPPFDPGQVRDRLRGAELACSVCSVLPGDRDIASPDPETRQRGIAYLKSLVATTAALGGAVLCGPLYAELYRARYVPPAQRAREWEWSVAGLRDMAKSAEIHGVTVAIEPINRFETDLLNLAEQAVRLVQDVGSPAVGVHLDTFHMAIEEKSQGQAIRTAGWYLKHLHACENYRGTPGTGQIPWREVGDALRAVGYEGYVVIEAFNPEVVVLANGARIWRPLAPTQDSLARDGLKLLKGLLG